MDRTGETTISVRAHLQRLSSGSLPLLCFGLCLRGACRVCPWAGNLCLHFHISRCVATLRGLVACSTTRAGSLYACHYGACPPPPLARSLASSLPRGVPAITFCHLATAMLHVF